MLRVSSVPRELDFTEQGISLSFTVKWVDSTVAQLGYRLTWGCRWE
jgi:hypothetical protein